MKPAKLRAAARQHTDITKTIALAPPLKPVFDRVLIFSPSVKTGGPEALHQLGHHIARNGGETSMVYYDRPFTVDGNVLRCGPGPFPLVEEYAQYQPRVVREARIGPDTLLVFPEHISTTAAMHAGQQYQRALWWLSVDNALPRNPSLLNKDYCRSFFGDNSLTHFFQSEYARTVLVNNKSQSYVPLFDYTNQIFIERSLNASKNIPIKSRGRTVCYFPTKGGELAERFISDSGSSRHDAEFIAIRNMTKEQVADALFRARIYIDFGNHPGKDRVPREAAIAGAVVLLHTAGAAQFYDDHPLSQDYHFTKDDIASGALRARVDAILDDPEAHFVAQRFYRQRILLEREQFDWQVRSFFFARA
jgi:hypothetical protein